MKRLLSTILAILMLLSTFASCSTLLDGHLCDECGKCNVANCKDASHEQKCVCGQIIGTGELPVYSKLPDGEEGFHLSIFGDPAQQTVEAYQGVKDLGCNWVYIDPWNGTNMDSAGLIKALEACEAVGLNALIMLGNSLNTETKDGGTFKSFLDFDAVDYTQYPAFKGVYAFDEPSVAQMRDWVANDLERWQNSKYKDYIYLVNLMKTDHDDTTAMTTESYFAKYWDLVLSKNKDNILMYDAYPLYANVGDKVEPYIREMMLKTLEGYAVSARDNGSEFYTYLQTYTEKDGSARDMVSVADARFQVAMYLAYGVQGFACFTYVSMNQFGPSMITANGQKLDKYYYVQEVFQEIKEFEPVYFSFDWQASMTIAGPNKGTDRGYGEQPEKHFGQLQHSIETHDRINTVETEYDLVIGTFKDKDKNDGFLISTYTDPYYMKDNNIKIDFNNATRALLYLNGKPITNNAEGTCYLLNDGVLEYDLEAGDYLFVVPVN